MKKERKKVEEAKQGKDKGASSLFNFFKLVDVPCQDAKVGYGTLYGTVYGTVHGTVYGATVLLLMVVCVLVAATVFFVFFFECATVV